MENSTTVGSLRKRVSDFRDKRHWAKFHNPKDLSMAVAIESAELLELFLWKDEEAINTMLQNQKRMQRVREEVADISIYLLSIADMLEIDLADAILNKLESNERRFPVPESERSESTRPKSPPRRPRQ